jgi:type II secretory pathway pseudopilin PulG
MRGKRYMVESIQGYNKKDSRVRKRGLAFTLTELLVIVVCVALLAAILLPALAKNKEKSRRAGCQNNLMQVGFAFRNWEGAHGDEYPMVVLTNASGTREVLTAVTMFRCFQVMSNELNNPGILVCPSDDRQPAADFAHLSNTNISYFLGPDADETYPGMWLAGDRNLVTNSVPVVPGLVVIKAGVTVEWSRIMHSDVGNIALSDGSVQQISSAGWRQLFQRSGTNVIRLVMP